MVRWFLQLMEGKRVTKTEGHVKQFFQRVFFWNCRKSKAKVETRFFNNDHDDESTQIFGYHWKSKKGDGQMIFVVCGR